MSHDNDLLRIEARLIVLTSVIAAIAKQNDQPYTLAMTTAEMLPKVISGLGGRDDAAELLKESDHMMRKFWHQVVED